MRLIAALLLLLTPTYLCASDTMDACLKTSGTAPFLVHCDATRVWSPVVECQSIESTHFYWNFGDSDTPTYVTGAKKNRDTGYQGSHVYETGGTYTVTLTIVHSTSGDTTPITETRTQTITVADEDTAYAGATIYVAASGNDTNDGSLANPIATFGEGRTRLLSTSGPRRLLLRRGDTFTCGTSYTVGSVTGPYHISDYGDAGQPIPVIANSNGNPILITSASPLELTYSDLKITGSNSIGLRPGNRTLALRCVLDGMESGVSTSTSYGSRDENGLFDCSITNSVKYGVYWNFGNHDSIVGCTIDGVTTTSPGEHLARTYLTHSNIRGNLFRGGRQSKHQLKFVGYTNPDKVEYTDISDNRFENPLGVAWMVAIAPVDDAKDELIEHCLIERNHFVAGPSTSVMLYAQNRNNIVRNNLFDMSGGNSTVTAIRVSALGVVPEPDGWLILNNTAYRPYTTSTSRMVQIDAEVLTTTVKNNLIEANAAVMTQGTGTTLIAAGNLATTDADFVSTTDFHLTSTSAAVGTGVVLPQVHDDFDLIVRPRGTSTPYDVGAYKYNP